MDPLFAEPGAGGYSIFGQTNTDGVIFAIQGSVPIGKATTIWLDTDLNNATGYQIWGFAGGAEYNIEIAADGSAALYSGGAGETFVANLDVAYNADRTGMEVAVAPSVAGLGDTVRVLADVNNAVFLPGDYANTDLVVGSAAVPSGAADLRVGIVYSETSAANYFNLTNYGQLVMSAQNQAMQAGIPFDLSGEADLTDAARLAEYDVLVFPGFANVPSDQLDAITRALELAVQAGTGLIAAGNFMRNDEAGAALPGNSYARLQSLLGVTLGGFGTTQGIEVVAKAGSNPVLDDYATGAIVGVVDCH